MLFPVVSTTSYLRKQCLNYKKYLNVQYITDVNIVHIYFHGIKKISVGKVMNYKTLYIYSSYTVLMYISSPSKPQAHM